MLIYQMEIAVCIFKFACQNSVFTLVSYTVAVNLTLILRRSRMGTVWLPTTATHSLQSAI